MDTDGTGGLRGPVYFNTSFGEVDYQAYKSKGGVHLKNPSSIICAISNVPDETCCN